MTANPVWGDDWDEVRRLWPLDPAVAHCNHGSFGAVPGPVLAAQDQFRNRMATNPMRWFDRELTGLVAQARADVAAFVGADAEAVAFVSNVSAGISAVMQSLELQVGDEVLSSDHIYGAVSSTVDRLCTRTGAVRVVVDVPVESSDEEVVSLFAHRCSQRTRLVVADQVTSATARRFPIEDLIRITHDVGAAILVDGAHAPGMLNLEVPKLGADFWVGNLHKWACAPPGTGILWVAPAWRERVLSLVVSWGEVDGFPISFERVGTDDLSAWLAAPSSLRLLGTLGWDRVRAHNEALVCWAQAKVAAAIGTQASELRHDPGLSMAVVPLPGGRVRTEEEARMMKNYMVDLGVEAAVGCWRGRGAIRLSAHVYNRPSDYDRLAVGARGFLAGDGEVVGSNFLDRR